jgi:hypothetical protein
MIFNLYVAVVLAIAILAIVVGTYTAMKAYGIGEAGDEIGLEERYEFEKNYSLVSTVGWMTLLSRLVAAPLFFITLISLIPSIPGAMCEFGVLQAGTPYSWLGFGIKFFTIFVFGGWLFLDHINNKVKGQKMIGSLSKMFVVLTPLLYVDAVLDILFFGSLKPLVVPCCMVVYTQNSFFQCPFCLVTYQMPLLLIAIPAFIIAVALLAWVTYSKTYIKRFSIQEESKATLHNAVLVSIVLTVLGLLATSVQLIIG